MAAATTYRRDRAAAERGHGPAQLMFGRYLAGGVAGEPHPAAARAWLDRAVAQGIAVAQDDLAALPSPWRSSGGSASGMQRVDSRK